MNKNQWIVSIVSIVTATVAISGIFTLMMIDETEYLSDCRDNPAPKKEITVEFPDDLNWRSLTPKMTENISITSSSGAVTKQSTILSSIAPGTPIDLNLNLDETNYPIVRVTFKLHYNDNITFTDKIVTKSGKDISLAITTSDKNKSLHCMVSKSDKEVSIDVKYKKNNNKPLSTFVNINILVPDGSIVGLLTPIALDPEFKNHG